MPGQAFILDTKHRETDAEREARHSLSKPLIAELTRLRAQYASRLVAGRTYTSIEINAAECPKGTLLRYPPDDGYMVRAEGFWIDVDDPTYEVRLLVTSFEVAYLPAASEKDAK